jgi:hypothetical protein
MLIILVQDKNTSLKLPVGVSPLQLVNLHRNKNVIAFINMGGGVNFTVK